MKYHFTPAMDDTIKKCYREQQPIGRKPYVRALANVLNMPRWRVSRRAREIGAYEPKIKEPEWSSKELLILKHKAHLHPEVIQRHLNKARFKRSVTGIILKRRRMRMLANLDGYSARQLAEGFGIDSKSIAKWIEKDLLQSIRRGTKRTERQGGDIYYIPEKSVRKFIIENTGLIDIRKVDKFWFVDIVANGGGYAL